MLKKILSSESCAACRVCCGFDKEDVWEMPLVTNELKEYIEKSTNAAAKFKKHSNAYSFDVSFKNDDELVSCPMLSDNGCILGDNKPFDCKVWPFRVMKLSDKLCCITVSPVCSCVSSLSVNELSDFLLNHRYENKKTLAQLLEEYSVEYPDAIKPYIDAYPILKIFEL